MLEKKQTLLQLHPEQHTDTHAYFQYEGDDDAFRVGYYLPMVDWVDMGSPNEITVTVIPRRRHGERHRGLRDAGERSERQVEWDIDRNQPMSVTHRQEQERLGA